MRKLMFATCMTFGFTGFVVAQSATYATDKASATTTVAKPSTTVVPIKTISATEAKVNKPISTSSNVQLATATPVNPDGSRRDITNKNTLKPAAKVTTEKTSTIVPVASTISNAQVTYPEPNSPSKLGQERDKHYTLPLNTSKTTQKNQQ